MHILKMWIIYFRKRMSRKRTSSRAKPVVQEAGAEARKGLPLECPSHYIPYPKR